MLRSLRSHAVALALLAATLSTAVAPPASQAEEEAAAKRVTVGEAAPDFTLPDPDGTDYTASALRGEKNLLLVFFRGAWWPFCRKQLGELQEHLETFDSLNTAVWSISPDEPDRLRSYRDEKDVKIPLLVDEDLAVIKAYGIHNERGRNVPHPTVVLVDREGVIRFFHLDENYRRRPSVETLLDAAREIGAKADG